jgi:hypothetical protein
MTKQTHSRFLVRSITVFALILTTGFFSACSGHRPGADPAAMSSGDAQSMQSAQQKKMAEAKMMARCMEMKNQKQKMMADMKAQDAELIRQVAMMNSAPKKEKVTMIAAIITSMVEQQTAMHARMEKMHGDMMQHMMQHMQMGKDSMAKCPMMKEMSDMKGMDKK